MGRLTITFHFLLKLTGAGLGSAGFLKNRQKGNSMQAREHTNEEKSQLFRAPKSPTGLSSQVYWIKFKSEESGRLIGLTMRQ